MTTYDQLLQALQCLNPTHINLENESMHHAGYFEGKESHFKLTIVSHEFVAKRLVSRHQAIYACVDTLMRAHGGTVHALAIHAYTPDEWQDRLYKDQQVPDSPECASKRPDPSSRVTPSQD